MDDSTHRLPEEIELIFASGGAAGSLMGEVDWAATAIGGPAQWPQSLRTAVSVCLSSRFPLLIFWGSELVMIYNDAFIPIVGGKHPQAMGQRAAECWAEIWDTIGPMLSGVLGGSGAIYAEDQMFLLERFGFPEECFFTFSYSPISEEAGRVGGVLVTAMETTGRVLGERRLRTLRAVAAQAAGQRTPSGVLAVTARALDDDRADVPVAVLHLRVGDHLGGGDGLGSGTDVVAGSGPDAARTALADDPRAGDAVSRAVDTGEQQVLDGLSIPVGDVVVREALALPIEATGVTAALMVGLNPRRPLDEDYRAFLDLLVGQLATGLSDAVAYEAERARAEALAELDAAKTAFFSNVSHEFRTPLTLMLGPLEDALADTDEPLPVRHRDRLDMVHRNGLRLLRLVNTLLDFSRLEAGRIHARYEPVDLAAYTTELASMFRSAVEKAGLVLDVSCEPLPAPVFVDRDMWEKIVGNLLSNALKFTFSGRISVVLEHVDDGVRLTVSDTGTGIPPQDQQHLFERFYRIQGGRARSHEGSGIGLALVAELTALHGGIVTVDSSPGEGSTFTVTLPHGAAHLPAEKVVEPGRAAAERAGTGPPGPSSAGFVEEALRWVDEPSVGDRAAPPVPPVVRDAKQDVRVLVVDDNADMRDYLTGLLGRYYQVEVARDGAEAIQALRRKPSHLVLADVMMPVMDGKALVRAIRDDPALAHLPVIMLSARAGEESAVEGLETGADDYLVKPFSTRELLARVRSNVELDRIRRGRVEMQRQQELLDQAQRLSRVGSWELDVLSGEFTGSQEFLRQVQLTAEELRTIGLEAGIAARVHPDDAERVRAAIAAALDGAPLDYEQRLLTPDGQERIYRVLAELERDEEGRPVRLRGSNQDITEQRQTELALAAAAAGQEAAAREHRIADELQRSLLPALTFTPEDLDVAVCYRAGAAETEIGGDWYDVIELGAGRTALVIGDVMGRGVQAAAVMGQLRAAVRAYSRLDLTPADVVELLDGVVRDLGSDHIVTCVYAVFDPSDDSLTFANAGHPMPVLVQPDGARLLTGPVNPPLGTHLSSLSETKLKLREGDLLALYTDGLVEQRGHDIDDGIDSLARLLAQSRLSLDALPAHLVDRLRPPGRDDDDIALLLVRVHRRAGRRPVPTSVWMNVDADEAAVSGARAFARTTLQSWGVPTPVAEDISLVVSELVTNAVLHGRPPIELRLRLTENQVVLEVQDATTVLPKRLRPSAEEEHGRGVQLASILADRWGARPTGTGKAVWCCFRLDTTRRLAGRVRRGHSSRQDPAPTPGAAARPR